MKSVQKNRRHGAVVLIKNGNIYTFYCSVCAASRLWSQSYVRQIRIKCINIPDICFNTTAPCRPFYLQRQELFFHVFSFTQPGIQDLLADTKRFRRYLQELVCIDKLQSLFQAEDFRRCQL